MEAYLREDSLSGVELFSLDWQKYGRDDQHNHPQYICPDVEPADITRRETDDEVRQEHHRDVNQVDVPHLGKVIWIRKLRCRY